jgi:hypothetical protein
MARLFVLCIFFWLFWSVSYAQTSGLSYNATNQTIVPKTAQLQPQLYPVFVFSIPEGFTDFELKASVTNFKDPNSNTSTHKGNDVVWYYNSAYPYLSGDAGLGIAPYQKFDIQSTYVYFQVSRALYTNDDPLTMYTQLPYSGEGWDSRRYIVQTIYQGSSLTNTDYAISHYMYTKPNITWIQVASSSTGSTTNAFINSASNSAGTSNVAFRRMYFRDSNYRGSRVGGVMVVIGWRNITAYADMQSTIKPTNSNLIWTIRFFNDAEGERDQASNSPVYRPIMPYTWVSDFSNKLKTD